MRIARARALTAMLVTSIGIAGCSTPFADSTSIDWAGKAGPGTIAVSDPKMYRREALINERSDEKAWIDDLLKDSKTIAFKPEIAREIETITSVSAALGLSFDPASALNYRRNQETGDLKQEIDVMRMQLQLDQLKRDAEIFRNKLAAQTDPVNPDLGKLGDPGVPAASSGVSAAAADQLKAAIDKLNAALVGRLDATGVAASVPTNVGVNPADLFRDRAAYRDTLKAARNAASLDELHDFDGAALLRLNFQAMIMPDRRNAAVPGIVQMRIIRPDIGDDERRRIYRGWLHYINEQINVPTDNGWQPNYALLGSGVRDNFDLVWFSYTVPRGVPAAAAPVAPAKGPAKPAKGAKPVKSQGAKVPVVECGGILLNDPGSSKGCATLVFAVPKFLGTSSQTGASNDLADYVDSFDPDDSEQNQVDSFMKAQSILSTDPYILGTYRTNSADPTVRCDLPHDPGSGPGSGPGRTLYRELGRSRLRAITGTVFADVDRSARRILATKGIQPPRQPLMDLIARRATRAELLLRTFERFAYPAACADVLRKAFRKDAGVVLLPPKFVDLFDRKDDRIAVYDVGPREQSQQVSTVARAANSLSLAISVAASAPGSGVAGNAAAGYSRQAMGRAAELERLPAVVGYSVLSSRTFGWVIGPRASVNPKGKIDLDQSLRSYDLSADLSVPGWLPYFCIESVTGWGARSSDISSGALAVRSTADAVLKCANPSDGPSVGASSTLSGLRMTRVSLSPNDSDYAWITSYVGLGDVETRRTVTLTDTKFTGQTVSACRPTTLIGQGPSIWRTTQVIVGGAKIPTTGISVAPDMSGVLIDVPALDQLLGSSATGNVRISLLTPYGVVDGSVAYEKPAAGCKPIDKPAAPAKPADKGTKNPKTLPAKPSDGGTQ